MSFEQGSGTHLVRLYWDAGTPATECSLTKFWKALKLLKDHLLWKTFCTERCRLPYYQALSLFWSRCHNWPSSPSSDMTTTNTFRQVFVWCGCDNSLHIKVKETFQSWRCLFDSECRKSARKCRGDGCQLEVSLLHCRDHWRNSLNMDRQDDCQCVHDEALCISS